MDEIMATLQRLERKIDKQQSAIRKLRLALADQRADVIGVKGDLATFRLDVTTRLGTIIDEIAAFRAEYNNHTQD